LRKILLASLISIIYGVIPWTWPDISQSWDMFALCKHVEIMVWLMVLFHFIPYKNLAAKTLVAVLVVVELIDVVSYPIWYSSMHPVLIYSVKAIASLVIFIYYWWRDYDKGNDILDEFNFFTVGIRPNGFQDFILSLLREPVGGVGVYAKGEFYHYRHGLLQIDSRAYIERLNSKYRIKRMRRCDARRLKVLKSLTKSKYSAWSWLWNCKTVLEPILGKRGKPLFYKELERE